MHSLKKTKKTKPKQQKTKEKVLQINGSGGGSHFRIL